ncbi:hypothetical protein, partial [uncultured Amnibacterium sp.]|uniref:hypothetical protein n=1 Tax=uncultured Amnibacterium sp. TaxID=1631851 RepID=UPI0035C9CC77
MALVVGLLVATPAPAATSTTHARAVAVASDAAHLVFKRRTSAADLTPEPQQGDLLYAADAAGRVTPLTDFQGASFHSVSLVGDFLVQASDGNGGTAQPVRYRNLV